MWSAILGANPNAQLLWEAQNLLFPGAKAFRFDGHLLLLSSDHTSFVLIEPREGLPVSSGSCSLIAP